MNRLLQDKTAIVTGARRGIGKAVTEILAKEGASVFACARTIDESFEHWAAELSENYSVRVIPVYFDVTDEDAVKKGIKSIYSQCDRIDILVNNAGVAAAGTLRMTSLEKLRQTFDVNFFAAIQIMQLVSGKMMRQKSGSIINIASAGGIEAQQGYLAYGSSKAALIWATKSISKELGNFNIRVNAVAPGQTKTDMGGVFKTKEEMEATMRRTALHRMAEPSEIANAVLFLASDLSSYVTGEILLADGGRVG